MGSTDVNCDFLIIGAGIFGTSAAYHLSQVHDDPTRIIVLDRAASPSPLAASSDMNKIIRADYVVPFYMDLAYEAMDGWLNDPLLSRYYHNTGWVSLGEKGSDISERVRNNFKTSGRMDTSSDRSLTDVKTSWGGVLSEIDTTDFDKAYFNASAGWAEASLAVSAWMQEAMSRGIKYVSGEVELVTHGQNLVGASLNGTTYKGMKILLAAGAWTPQLMLPVEKILNIPPELSIDRQIQAAGVCVAAFKLNKSEVDHYSQMPVLVYGSKGEVMPPNADGWLKFTNASTFLNTISYDDRYISIPHRDQSYVPAKLREQSLELIRQRIPQILQTHSPEYWRLCWDAVSPDQNQLICQHPKLTNLFLATAGSFHSWKFLPNIGKYIVNVLHDRSNGEEKDKAWCWKSRWSDQGAHPKVAPCCELREYEIPRI